MTPLQRYQWAIRPAGSLTPDEWLTLSRDLGYRARAAWGHGNRGRAIDYDDKARDCRERADRALSAGASQ